MHFHIVQKDMVIDDDGDDDESIWIILTIYLI
jgi:hypothetical protein